MNPTTRFSNRVENYIRYRPRYPHAVLDVLKRVIGLAANWQVADLGSGTGISCELFLAEGHAVYGVEPNAAMRDAAERLLAGFAMFHSVDGTAEATTLDAHAFDMIVAAQAFHWFDIPRVRAECQRVLRPGGWVVLLWNTRQLDTTPFLREYETLLQRHGTDYITVRHNNIDAAQLDAFYGAGQWRRFTVANTQELDLDGLRGRLLSSSYVPNVGEPGCAEMLAELDELFARHAVEGQVALDYTTEIYAGKLTVAGSIA
jgi:SAM-dependent methyltransferase